MAPFESLKSFGQGKELCRNLSDSDVPGMERVVGA